MMRQYELVERVASYNPREGAALLLNRAYVYAMTKHGGQRRASGDPYFSHPLEVAAILTDMRLDEATIATALLHDTIEDTDATKAEIDELFGGEIGKLVEGLTKIGRIETVSPDQKHGENLRKLLLAMADDVRVLLVKLADRLHNMRTLHYVPPDKRQRIAQETMEVYAPLAGKMGIEWMREELENLAFRVLEPEVAGLIERRLERQREVIGTLFDEIRDTLTKALSEKGIDAKVTGREKKPYSIHLKMQRKRVNFEHLSDIYGFRVIVDDVVDCYAALGVIHTTWQFVPTRFKDHISMPKPNGYRSLHTTIHGPFEQRIEVQIRTQAMHRVAEYGLAAHVLYKDGEPGTTLTALRESEAYAWLRQTVAQLSDGGSPQDFLENTKLELFQDHIYCFTPKGRVIALPPGATPIDFAYQVHTDVGNTCVGCRINGHDQPLFTPLKSGDEVEILCKEGAVPKEGWLAIVSTGKARAAVRKAEKQLEERKFTRLGQQLLENAAQRWQITGELGVATALEKLGEKDEASLYAGVGRGRLKAEEALCAMGFDAPAELLTAPRQLPIVGVGDLPVTFAPAHRPIPGDKIIGILRPGEGVTIYPANACEAMGDAGAEPQRWLSVGWDADAIGTVLYPAAVRVVAQNEPGALAEISGAIAEEAANIDDLFMAPITSDYREMSFHIEVRDVSHLSRVLDRLRRLRTVSEATRTTH